MSCQSSGAASSFGICDRMAYILRVASAASSTVAVGTAALRASATTWWACSLYCFGTARPSCWRRLILTSSSTKRLAGRQRLDVGAALQRAFLDRKVREC